MTAPHGPLQGVKVVACSTAQAGTVPYMLMADLGAEVIKIEVPEGGDNSRGTSIVANSIADSGVNGLLLNAATDLLVGGTATGVGNTIVTSAGYGLLAVGACNRTRVIRNLIAGNTLGDMDLASSTGITYVP